MNQSPLYPGASGPTLQRSAPGATLATASDGAATEQSSPERHGALLRQGAAAATLSEARADGTGNAWYKRHLPKESLRS